MGLRAVISEEAPTSSFEGDDLGFGSARGDEDEHGVSTAAFASILEGIDPGQWYPLEAFEDAVSKANWTSAAEEWTILEIAQPNFGDEMLVPIEVQLVHLVRSMCEESVAFLRSLGSPNIWVRLE